MIRIEYGNTVEELLSADEKYKTFGWSMFVKFANPKLEKKKMRLIH